MASRRNFNYSCLVVDEDDYDDDGNKSQNDPRFNYNPKTFDKIPWKSIILAIFLLVLGCLFLLLSSFIITGHMEGESSQAYGLLGLGLLTFLRDISIFSFSSIDASVSSKNWLNYHDSMRLELRTIHGEVPKAIGFRQFLIINPSAASSHIGIVFSFLFYAMCGFKIL